jgi:hypothetical protein
MEYQSAAKELFSSLACRHELLFARRHGIFPGLHKMVKNMLKLVKKRYSSALTNPRGRSMLPTDEAILTWPRVVEAGRFSACGGSGNDFDKVLVQSHRHHGGYCTLHVLQPPSRGDGTNPVRHNQRRRGGLLRRVVAHAAVRASPAIRPAPLDGNHQRLGQFYRHGSPARELFPHGAGARVRQGTAYRVGVERRRTARRGPPRTQSRRPRGSRNGFPHRARSFTPPARNSRRWLNTSYAIFKSADGITSRCSRPFLIRLASRHGVIGCNYGCNTTSALGTRPAITSNSSTAYPANDMGGGFFQQSHERRCNQKRSRCWSAIIRLSTVEMAERR